MIPSVLSPKQGQASVSHWYLYPSRIPQAKVYF